MKTIQAPREHDPETISLPVPVAEKSLPPARDFEVPTEMTDAIFAAPTADVVEAVHQASERERVEAEQWATSHTPYGTLH